MDTKLNDLQEVLLSAAAAVGASAAIDVRGKANMTFQASGATTAGAGSAVVVIDVSNDGVNWIVAGTITLVLSTTTSTDGFAAQAAWSFVRARVSAISGTGATATVTLGV